MAKILGITGLVFSLLSIIALIGPNTPIGTHLRKITFLNNKNFNKTHNLYSKCLYYLCLGIILVFGYLFLIYFNFFTIQKLIFNVLYMGCLLFILMIIINIRTTKIFEYEIMFLKFFTPFLSFLLILFAVHFILDSKFNNGELNRAYDKFKADERITLIPLDTLNALQLRNYFSDEYKLNSGIILLNELKNAYNFKIDLKNPIRIERNNINKIQNECADIYNKSNLDKNFIKRIDEQISYINKRKTGKLINIFPPQIQPNYVSSYLVYNYSSQFSTLAKGSKMYLTIGYLKILSNLGLIGFWVIVTLIPLISIILTKKINVYNIKYEKINTDSHNLFFMFVSVIGLMIAIWSLL
jgi:hypothetical protein